MVIIPSYTVQEVSMQYITLHPLYNIKQCFSYFVINDPYGRGGFTLKRALNPWHCQIMLRKLKYLHCISVHMKAKECTGYVTGILFVSYAIILAH